MKTRQLADGSTSQVLLNRYIGGSQLVCEWYPPGRYTMAELWFSRDGAVQVKLGRLELGRYRRNAR